MCFHFLIFRRWGLLLIFLKHIYKTPFILPVCPLMVILRTNINKYRPTLTNLRRTESWRWIIQHKNKKIIIKWHWHVWGTFVWLLLYFSILMWTLFFFVLGTSQVSFNIYIYLFIYEPKCGGLCHFLFFFLLTLDFTWNIKKKMCDFRAE